LASNIGFARARHQTAHVAHGHSHGGEVSWRPARRIRIALLAALAPFVVATVAGLVLLWPSHHHQAVPLQYQTYGSGTSVYEKGDVTSVTSRACGGTAGPGNTPSVCSTAHVVLTSGPDKGHVVTLDTGGPADVNLRVNDHIRVLRGPVINTATGAREYSFDDYIRDTPLIALAAFFAVVLVLVARWRGITAIAGLAVAYLVLVYFLLPALLDGRSPVETALVAGAAILLVVLYVAHGFSMRTTTALLGTLIALGFTAGFAAIATSASRLTGRSNEIYAELQGAGVRISISGLILCGLIVGALGVINDITVTQASSVWELSAADPQASWRTLFTSGMRIGRDHIASVVYTLVFAYTGAALPILLLFSISGRNLHDLVTGDEIAGEIVRNLVGGTGLILAVPFTTLIAAIVAARPRGGAETAPIETQGDPEHHRPAAPVQYSDAGLDELDARIARSSLRAAATPYPVEPPPEGGDP
jgi:uncharacterized membrane protein